eukprot:gene51614-70290_t
MVLDTVRLSGKATVVVTHLDAVDHATVSRADLRRMAAAALAAASGANWPPVMPVANSLALDLFGHNPSIIYLDFRGGVERRVGSRSSAYAFDPAMHQSGILAGGYVKIFMEAARKQESGARSSQH